MVGAHECTLRNSVNQNRAHGMSPYGRATCDELTCSIVFIGFSHAIWTAFERSSSRALLFFVLLMCMKQSLKLQRIEDVLFLQ